MKLLLSILTVCLVCSGCQLSEYFKKEVEGKNLISFPEKEPVIESEDQKTVLEPEPVKTISVDEIKPEVKPDPLPENDLAYVDDWLCENVKDWPVTVTMTANQSGDNLYFGFDKMEWKQFSVKKDVRGCIWAIVKVDGKYKASPFEFFTGQNNKKGLGVLTYKAYDQFVGYSKMKGWQWKKGEEIGLFVTAGNVRRGHPRYEERSNVVKVVRK